MVTEKRFKVLGLPVQKNTSSKTAKGIKILIAYKRESFWFSTEMLIFCALGEKKTKGQQQ